MIDTVDALVEQYKRLKQHKPHLTIEGYVADLNHGPDIADDVAHLLYHDMFEASLKKTVGRKVIDFIRTIKPDLHLTLEDAITNEPEHFNAPDNHEDQLVNTIFCQEALRRLSELERQILYWYYIDGYNDREIHEMLGKPYRNESTVRKKRERARKKLRKLL